MYEAMARRYRPSQFEEVVGQEHVARTLRNALEADRVAHAYLFAGPHGCGKTSMARILAKSLTCEKGPTVTPCDACDFCHDIMRGQDVDVQEIDGASNNSVDQVRSLREQAGYVPTRGRFKIYIIDEVHMLSGSAANALLKTLEEPPPHVKFILATTDPHRLPETVISRCQRFDFRLVPPPLLASFLKELAAREKAEIAAEALDAVAAFSTGSVRDGLVLLDQLLSYAQGEVTREDVERVRGVARAEAVAGLMEAIAAHDVQAALGVVDEVAQRGVSVGDYLDQLIEFCRDLMLKVATGKEDGITAYGPARESLMGLAGALPLAQVLLMLDLFTQARIRVRGRGLTNQLVPLEMAVARLAGLENLEPVGQVVQKLDALARGAPLPAVQPVAGRLQNAAPTAPTSVPPAAAAEARPPPSPRKAAPPPASPAKPQTEAPEPAGSEEPEAGNRSVTKEDAVSAWPQILASMAEANSPDLPFLRENVFVHDVDGDRLILTVPGAFHFEQLEVRQRKTRIAEHIEKVLGVRLRLQLRMDEAAVQQAKRRPGGEPGPRRESPEVRAQDEACNDPAVRSIVSSFKGQVMNVEKDEGV